MYNNVFGGFLSHGGTPSSHPFYFRIVQYKPSICLESLTWKAREFEAQSMSNLE